MSKHTEVPRPPRAPARRAAKASKETGSARAYRILRDQILRLELAPGEAVDEVRLSERFGMSRSPVREALARLSSEGLVVVLANRSTIVTPMDFQRVPEFLDALDLLQRTVTRLAAIHRTPGDLTRIVDAHNRYAEAIAHSIEVGDSLPMIEANYDFHMAIAAAARNHYFADLYRKLMQEGRRMLHLHFEYRTQDSITVEVMTADHALMVDAIAAHDVDKAEEVAHAHAMQFKGQFMQFLNRNLSAKVQVVYSRDATSGRMALDL